jgi:hypothetical protein
VERSGAFALLMTAAVEEDGGKVVAPRLLTSGGGSDTGQVIRNRTVIPGVRTNVAFAT